MSCFARRLTARTVRPRRRSARPDGNGKRRSWRRCSTESMVRPSHAASKPRRTVSTSGSSGILWPPMNHEHEVVVLQSSEVHDLVEAKRGRFQYGFDVRPERVGVRSTVAGHLEGQHARSTLSEEGGAGSGKDRRLMGLSDVLKDPRHALRKQGPKQPVMPGIAQDRNQPWSSPGQGGQVPHATRREVHGNQPSVFVHQVMEVTDGPAVTCAKVQCVAFLGGEQAKGVPCCSQEAGSNLRAARVPPSPFDPVDATDRFAVHKVTGVRGAGPQVTLSTTQALGHGRARRARRRPSHHQPLRFGGLGWAARMASTFASTDATASWSSGTPP